jgi:negative regulator of flagellin synthesis FlgM
MTMRVENHIPSEIPSAQSGSEAQSISPRRAAEQASGKSKPETDEVIVSSEARELQRIRRVLDMVPDARDAQVNAIRQQVQEGSYKVDVDRLINNLLGQKSPGE